MGNNVNLDSNKLNIWDSWSEKTIQLKLEGIKNLTNKSSGWIQSDLGIGKSLWLGRVLWCIISKFSCCSLYYREKIYKVNLEKSKTVLAALGERIKHLDNEELYILYADAVKKFNDIAVKHQVVWVDKDSEKKPDEKEGLSENQTKINKEKDKLDFEELAFKKKQEVISKN